MQGGAFNSDLAVRKLMRQVIRKLEQPQSFWELLAVTNAPIEILAQALHQLLDESLIRRHGPKFARTGPAPKEPDFSTLTKEMQSICRQRPRPDTVYDQGPIWPELTVERVKTIFNCGDLEGSNLLILGDDDLVGIAAAMTGLPNRVTVLEIDPRLVEFISQTSSAYNLNLEVRLYDAQKELPSDLDSQFTLAVTDPVETKAGFKLFLSRCAQALVGPGAALYLGLTSVESSVQRWYDLERAILQAGFAITMVIPQFHRYTLPSASFVAQEYPEAADLIGPPPPADLPWYTSSLLRLEAVKELCPPYVGPVTLGKLLYRDR